METMDKRAQEDWHHLQRMLEAGGFLSCLEAPRVKLMAQLAQVWGINRQRSALTASQQEASQDGIRSETLADLSLKPVRTRTRKIETRTSKTAAATKA